MNNISSTSSNISSIRYLNPKKTAQLSGQYQYELDTGFINIIRTLQRIYGIPEKNVDTTQQYPQIQLEWIKNEFEKIFTKIHPGRTYNIEAQDIKKKNVSENQHDFFGTLLITVQENEQDLFSFKLEMTESHGRVFDIRNLNSIDNRFDFIKLHKEFLNLSNSPTTEITQLLLPYEKRNISKYAVYNILGSNLDDIDAKVISIKNINKIIMSTQQKSNFYEFAKGCLYHILRSIPYNDNETIKKLSLTFVNLMESPDQDIRNFLSQNVTRLLIENHQVSQENLKFLQEFKNLEYLNLDGLISDTTLSFKLSNLENLKYIKMHVVDKNFDEIILENLPNIETIDFRSYVYNNDKNKKLFITARKLPKLSYIYFENSYIDKIEIENCYNLSTISLKSIEVNPTLSFKNLNSLTQLNLEDLKITKFPILENCPNLKKITLNSINELKEVSLQQFTNLEMIGLTKSYSIESVTLKNLPILKSLYIENTINLKELALENVSKLEILILERTGISELPDLKILPNIKKLNFSISNFHNDTELSLNGLQSLNELILSSNSNLKKVTLTDLPSLTYIDMAHSKNLEEVSLQNLPQLKSLILDKCSKLKTITGITNRIRLSCRGCENLTSTDNKKTSYPPSAYGY